MRRELARGTAWLSRETQVCLEQVEGTGPIFTHSHVSHGELHSNGDGQWFARTFVLESVLVSYVSCIGKWALNS